MQNNVVIAIFDVESEAYQAFSELKKTNAGEGYVVPEAVLFKNENGTINVIDGFSITPVDSGTAQGIVIGSLMGVIGGPIGVILGASLGAQAGMASDSGRALGNASVVAVVASKIFEGEIAIAALVGEDEPAFDAAFADFKTTIDSDDAKTQVANVVDIEINDDWAGSEFRYCTEFLFHADSPDFDEEANLRYLATMGDCELLVGANPDYKIHVHTNRPDRVLRHMIHRGQIFNVFVHNMDLEAQERTEGIRADKEAAQVIDVTPKKALGFVAVAAGDGQAEILRSLGVDVVVSGGQTMNPSTADILEAIENAHAENVIVLPDNGNIRMAAEAAVLSCESCKAAVVPTRTVLQAFAAMFVMDADASLEENVEEMTEAIADVRGGEVTTAVRDSQAADGSPIHAGDVMGIEDDAITVVGCDVAQVTLDLINRMQEAEEGDTLTILAGSDLSDEAFEALTSAIEEAQPELEIDAHRGEQPLYPVVFSLE